SIGRRRYTSCSATRCPTPMSSRRPSAASNPVPNPKGKHMSKSQCPTDTRKLTELTSRAPTIEDVRRTYLGRSTEFDFLRLCEANIYHTIAVSGGWAIVIGERDNASYEWVYVRCDGTHYVGPPGYVPRAEEDEEWEHSNAGYGSDAGALLAV